MTSFKWPFVQLIFLCTFLVFMEWLFFLTKPSFMGSATTIQKINFLTTVSWLLTVSTLALAVVVHFIEYLLDKILSWPSEKLLAPLLPTVLSTILTVILTDNFTYTVVRWGIQHTGGISLLAYEIFLCITFLFWYRYFFLKAKRAKAGIEKYKFTIALSLLALLTVMVPGRLLLAKLKQESSLPVLSSPKTRPNIIIFSPDGIEADHMSIYGYHRNTTPNLKKYSSQMLIAENTITNSGKSTGSATALLTGRLPTTTHVLFPPQVLTGQNSEKHLPGLLWKLGYKNFQETARFYLDGPDLGMKDAFDIANGRKVGNRFSKNLHPTISVEFFSDFYFLAQIKDRITERFAHLFRVREMSNPFDEVNHDNSEDDFRVYATPDAIRMQRAFAFIDESSEPFFMHLHLMNSHCCKFRPEKKFFYKAGIGAEKPVNNTDLYDDAILETDRYFGQLMEFLAKKGKLENTVVIYLSDHGRIWTSALRVPLVFYFGKSMLHGTIKETAQLIDVAPTLLDYMGLVPPEWLEGHSLLNKEKRKAVRPLVSVAAVETQWFQGKGNEDLARLVNMGPPYFGAKRISVTYCHKQFRLELKTGRVDVFNLRNHTSPCLASDVPSPEQAIAYLKDHLSERKFGVKK